MEALTERVGDLKAEVAVCQAQLTALQAERDKAERRAGLFNACCGLCLMCLVAVASEIVAWDMGITHSRLRCLGR